MARKKRKLTEAERERFAAERERTRRNQQRLREVAERAFAGLSSDERELRDTMMAGAATEDDGNRLWLRAMAERTREKLDAQDSHE